MDWYFFLLFLLWPFTSLNVPSETCGMAQIRHVKWSDYAMIQVFVYMKTCLGNSREGKMGKINDEMDSKTSKWFFLHWFHHDISMVLRNKEIRCYTHKPMRV